MYSNESIDSVIHPLKGEANKAYYVNHIQEMQANACFRLSVVEGETRIGLFVKRSIKQSEELLAYYGSECKAFFNAGSQNGQPFRRSNVPTDDGVNAVLTSERVLAKRKCSEKAKGFPPSTVEEGFLEPGDSIVITNVGISKHSAGLKLTGMKKVSVEDEPILLAIDSPSFQIPPTQKHLYFIIINNSSFRPLFTDLHQKCLDTIK